MFSTLFLLQTSLFKYLLIQLLVEWVLIMSGICCANNSASTVKRVRWNNDELYKDIQVRLRNTGEKSCPWSHLNYPCYNYM